MTDVFSIAQGNSFYNPPCALEKAQCSYLACVRSPKSAAFPSVCILIYSIPFTGPDGDESESAGDRPPAKTPRVGDPAPFFDLVVVDKSAYRVALPRDANSNLDTYETMVVGDGCTPPPTNPLV